jgi:hypothetical protein
MRAENCSVHLPLFHDRRLCIVTVFDAAVRGARIAQIAGFATINDEIMSIINITYGSAMMAGQTCDSLKAQAAQENKMTTNVDGGRSVTGGLGARYEDDLICRNTALYRHLRRISQASALGNK